MKMPTAAALVTVVLAAAFCGGAMGRREAWVCPDNTANTVPVVFTGSTVDDGESHFAPCYFGSGAPDVVVEWTCPAAGEYSASTAGSDFDTVLGVVQSTTCPAYSAHEAFACNDDYPDVETLTSYLEFTCANSGDVFFIVVDGWIAIDMGNYVLAIDRVTEA